MVPGVTHVFVQNCMEQCFKIYIRNARTDRYSLMCSIDAHEKQQLSSANDGNSGGGNTLPSNSSTEALSSIGETIGFIYFWLKFVDRNYLSRSNMFIETMQYFFLKYQFSFLNHLVIIKNANSFFILLEMIGA